MSDLEDISSKDISIDKLYLKDFQKRSASSWKSLFLDDEQLSSILLLERPEEFEQAYDSILASKALHTAYLMFLARSDFERGHLVLRGLNAIVEESSSSQLRKITQFEVMRAHALGYFKEGKYTAAIKQLNTAIATCPTIHGSFVDGLSDALIVLADAYSAIGRSDDALHSSRLAVDTAHERLDRMQKNLKPPEPAELRVAGPTLDPLSSTILSYCTLAGELDKSGMNNIAAEWYQRAYQVAQKFKVDDDIVREIQRQLQFNQPMMQVEPRSPVLAAAHVRYPTRQLSMEVDRKSDPDSVDPWFVPSNKGREEFRPLGGDAGRSRERDNNDHQDAERSKARDSARISVNMNSTSGKTRPRSALPILFRGKHGEYSDDERAMENSLEKYTDQGSRASPQPGELDHYFPEYEAARPKSALSKLGGGYQYAQKRPKDSYSGVPQPPPMLMQLDHKHASKTRSSSFTSQPEMLHAPVMRDVIKMPVVAQREDIRTGPLNKSETVDRHQSSEQTIPTLLASRGIHSIIMIPSGPTAAPSDVSSTEDSGRKWKVPSPQSTLPLPVKKKGTTKAPPPENTEDIRRKVPKGRAASAKESILKSSQSQPVLVQPHPQSADQLVRSKTNRTLLSKTMSSTANMSLDPGGGAKTHGAAVSVAPTTNAPPTAVQNWMLNIDEFGKSKLNKRLSDLYLPYFKGLRVEAKYQVNRLGDRGKWYPGRIVRADFLNGLYDVEFENGDKEKNIFVDDIRIPEHSSKLAMIKAAHNPTVRSTKDATSTDTGGSRSQASVLRQQNIDGMHNSVMRIIAGVSQRSDARKIERITLKNSRIVTIQALIRGAITRTHFPRIREQILRERDLRKLEKELRAKEEAIQRFSEQIQEDNWQYMATTISTVPPEQVTMGVQTDAEMTVWPNDVNLPPNADLEDELIHGDYVLDDQPVYVTESQLVVDSPPRGMRTTDLAVNEPSLAIFNNSNAMIEQSYRLFQSMEADQSLALIQDMLAALRDQQRKLLEYQSIRQGSAHEQFHVLQSEIMNQRDEFHRLRMAEDQKRVEMVTEIKSLITGLEHSRSQAMLMPMSGGGSPTMRLPLNEENDDDISLTKASHSMAEDFIQSVSSADIPNFIRSLASMEEQIRAAADASRPQLTADESFNLIDDIDEATISEPVSPERQVSNMEAPYEGDIPPPQIERYMSTHNFDDLEEFQIELNAAEAAETLDTTNITDAHDDCMVEVFAELNEDLPPQAEPTKACDDDSNLVVGMEMDVGVAEAEAFMPCSPSMAVIVPDAAIAEMGQPDMESIASDSAQSLSKKISEAHLPLEDFLHAKLSFAPFDDEQVAPPVPFELEPRRYSTSSTLDVEDLFVQPELPASIRNEITRCTTFATAGVAAGTALAVAVAAVSTVALVLNSVTADIVREAERRSALDRMSPDIEKLIAHMHFDLINEPVAVSSPMPLESQPAVEVVELATVAEEFVEEIEPVSNLVEPTTEVTEVVEEAEPAPEAVESIEVEEVVEEIAAVEPTIEVEEVVEEIAAAEVIEVPPTTARRPVRKHTSEEVLSDLPQPGHPIDPDRRQDSHDMAIPVDAAVMEEVVEESGGLEDALPSANDLQALLQANGPLDQSMSMEAVLEDVMVTKKNLPQSQEVDELLGELKEMAPYAITVSALASSSVVLSYNDCSVIPLESIAVGDKIKLIYLLPDAITENPRRIPAILRLFANNDEEDQLPVGTAGDDVYKMYQDALHDDGEARAADEQVTEVVQPVTEMKKPRPKLLLEVKLRPAKLLEIFESMRWMQYQATPGVDAATHSPFAADAEQSAKDTENVCFLRGSLIRMDYVLRLIVDLWEAYMLWMVQSVHLHSHATVMTEHCIMQLKAPDRPLSNDELAFRTHSFYLRQLATQTKGSDLDVMETITDELDDSEDKEKESAQLGSEVLENAPSPIPAAEQLNHDDEVMLKYISTFRDGRKMFVASIHEINALEKDFERELENWELDLRRYHDNLDYDNLESASRMDDGTQGQYAEIVLSNAMQALCNRIQKFVSMKFIDHRAKNGGIASSDDADYIVLAIASCRERWASRWERALTECILAFVQSLGLFDVIHSKDQVLSNTLRCCELIFDMTMHYMTCHDWSSYWTHRDRAVALIHQSGLDKVLLQVEDLMYAPVFAPDSLVYREGKSAKSVRGVDSMVSLERSVNMEDGGAELPDTTEFIALIKEVTAHLT